MAWWKGCALQEVWWDDDASGVEHAQKGEEEMKDEEKSRVLRFQQDMIDLLVKYKYISDNTQHCINHIRIECEIEKVGVNVEWSYVPGEGTFK